MRTHQSQNESLGVQEVELAKAQADRVAEIDSINRKYDAFYQDLVNEHQLINEMRTHNVGMATQAYEEIRVRLQGELERISACKLVGCGVEDVIMVAASTGARPNVELMKKQNVDFEFIKECQIEADIQEATGIQECGDMYRVLQAVRSVIDGHGVPAMFDMKGREGLADGWGADRVCEWFGC